MSPRRYSSSNPAPCGTLAAWKRHKRNKEPFDDLCLAAAPETRYRDGDGLTRRLREVAILVAQGLSNSEISAKLFLSEDTVKTHLRRLFERTHSTSRVEVAAYVYQHGLIPVLRRDLNTVAVPRDAFNVLVALVGAAQRGDAEEALRLADRASSLVALRRGAPPTDRRSGPPAA